MQFVSIKKLLVIVIHLSIGFQISVFIDCTLQDSRRNVCIGTCAATELQIDL